MKKYTGELDIDENGGTIWFNDSSGICRLRVSHIPVTLIKDIDMIDLSLSRLDPRLIFKSVQKSEVSEEPGEIADTASVQEQVVGLVNKVMGLREKSEADEVVEVTELEELRKFVTAREAGEVDALVQEHIETGKIEAVKYFRTANGSLFTKAAYWERIRVEEMVKARAKDRADSLDRVKVSKDQEDKWTDQEPKRLRKPKLGAAIVEDDDGDITLVKNEEE